MNEEENAVRRRDVSDLPDEEILDESEQQKIIDDIENEYRSIAAGQSRFIGIYGSIFFGIMLILSITTKDYSLFFLPGLAAGALAGMVLIRPNWALAVSLSIETVALIEVVQIWQSRPALLVLGVHAAYAFAIWLRIDSVRFTRSIPEQLKRLEKLKYHVKVA
jgi:hypothetical protein